MKLLIDLESVRPMTLKKNDRGKGKPRSSVRHLSAHHPRPQALYPTSGFLFYLAPSYYSHLPALTCLGLLKVGYVPRIIRQCCAQLARHVTMSISPYNFDPELLVKWNFPPNTNQTMCPSTVEKIDPDGMLSIWCSSIAAQNENHVLRVAELK